MALQEPTAWALPLGAALDAALGDPRGWPHPVRWLGRAIGWAEIGARALVARLGGGPIAGRLAGIGVAAIVIGLAGVSAWGLVALADRSGGPAPLLVRVVLIHWGLAARSLRAETRRASEAIDLETARRELAWIVGRDTEDLDWPEIGRACLETVGENLNDGVVAPLFWYALGGPVGLWIFKAASTLDSMIGYRDARHRDLGWASARLDDALAFVPARLTWLLIALASAVVGERPRSALRIGWRDGRKHPSPNSAWGEAALAGALGVRLGGPATYRGIPGAKPLLGEPIEPIDRGTVRRALRIAAVVTALAVALAWAGRLPIIEFSQNYIY